jgi:hypothetical protein
MHARSGSLLLWLFVINLILYSNYAPADGRRDRARQV